MQNQLFSLHTNENKWTIYEFLFKIMKIYRNPMFLYENQWDFYQHQWTSMKTNDNHWFASSKTDENINKINEFQKDMMKINAHLYVLYVIKTNLKRSTTLCQNNENI